MNPTLFSANGFTRFVRIAALAGALSAGAPIFLTTALAQATTNAAVESTDKDAAAAQKAAKTAMKGLKLDDAGKEAKVNEILTAHFEVTKAWHIKNDSQITALWSQFDKARGAANKDEAKAAGFMSQIDGIYETLKPEHEALLAKLGAVLTPEQIDGIKDGITVNKVKVTYNAYGEIFHGLTEPQKAFILKNLKTAREEAIDAGPMKEKSAFFKKYKIRIEAYLTEQGYDVKKSYQDFTAKQKADAAAKDGAKPAVTKPAQDENK